MVDARGQLYPQVEHRTPTDTPPSPPRWRPVARLWSLALGLSLLVGTGCEADVGRAAFCHSLLIGGQPAVLRLTQGEQTFMANTGDCSPCGRFKVNDTFDLQVRDPAGNQIAERFIYLPSNPRTYLLVARANTDGTVRLDLEVFGNDVSCKQVRAMSVGERVGLRAEDDGEEDEDVSLFTPADPNATSPSP